MPPGSEAFITALLNTILSQYGALVSGLTIGIWYFANQLAKERAAHSETTDRLIVMTEKNSESNNAVAQALSSMRSIMERIAFDRGGGERGRDRDREPRYGD